MARARSSAAPGVIEAIADTAYVAILGWRAGEQHWRVVLTGFAQASDYHPGPVRADELQSSPPKGATLLESKTGIEVTGLPGDGLFHSSKKARGGILVAWRAGRATPYRLAGYWLAEETQPAHKR